MAEAKNVTNVFAIAIGGTNADTLIFANQGAPSADTMANIAGKGSLCIDTTNAKLYINSGTKKTPSWSEVGATV